MTPFAAFFAANLAVATNKKFDFRGKVDAAGGKMFADTDDGESREDEIGHENDEEHDGGNDKEEFWDTVDEPGNNGVDEIEHYHAANAEFERSFERNATVEVKAGGGGIVPPAGVEDFFEND